MRKVLTIVLILLVLNCASFVIARICLCFNGGTAARFERVTYHKSDELTLTYLIAGNLNQAKTAFQFLQPELQGRVTYAQFRMMGWNAKATAQNIAHEIEVIQPDRIEVYTISLGDHVGRYLDSYLDDYDNLQIIAINPCSDLSFMCSPLGPVLKIGSPIVEILCHGLGWLSAIPIIPTPAGNYSLILLADQYWSIAYDHPEHNVNQTIGVICSHPRGEFDPPPKLLPAKMDNDGLLQNPKIRAYFQHDLGDDENVRIVTIDTKHGATVECGDKYLDGIRQILSGEVDE